MALKLAWYDFVCFGIVAGAIVSSLLVIFRKEGGRRSLEDDRTEYESLVIVAGGAGPRLMPLSLTAHVGSAHMWMSCWRGVHPGWLLGLRLVAVVAMVGILSWDIWLYGSSIMLYYTEWTFMLVIFYFMMGTAISAHGCWLYSRQQALAIASDEANKFIGRGITKNGHASLTVELNRYNDTIRQHSHHEQEENEKRAGNLGYLMQIVYQTTAGAVMLTDVVFWCLLVPFLSIEHFSLTKIMCCMHSFNVVFLLLDTSLNSLPFPWFRMAYLVLWSCLYVIFQWVLHACGFTWWPYPFLELSIPWAPAWYIGMALVHIPCYGFYWLIVKAKNSFFPKFFPQTYLMSY